MLLNGAGGFRDGRGCGRVCGSGDNAAGRDQDQHDVYGRQPTDHGLLCALCPRAGRPSLLLQAGPHVFLLLGHGNSSILIGMAVAAMKHSRCSGVL